MVVLDPLLKLATHVFPCEDGHAQERSLLDQVLPCVEKGDLWMTSQIPHPAQPQSPQTSEQKHHGTLSDRGGG